MFFSRKKKGEEGEGIAAKYLAGKGFTMVTRNFRCKGGEIDLIATRSGELHFIEVKTRSNAGFGAPAESVNLHKQKRLSRAAFMFLAQNQHWAKAPHCFSVVAIEGNKIDLFLNAFAPTGGTY